MAPSPSRVVLAPQLEHALVHDGPPEGREERQEDAARVAQRELVDKRRAYIETYAARFARVRMHTGQRTP